MAKQKIIQTIIAISGKVSPELSKSVKTASDMFGGLKDKALSFASKAAIATAAVKATKALVNLGLEFDSVKDSIRIGTGATGENLEALTNSFKKVYENVPSEMQDVGSAIADYNTRLGITGDVLEGLSEQALKASHVTGEGVKQIIESSSKAFQAWNIDMDKYQEAMDYAFKTSQSTGVAMNILLSQAQTYASQLQSIGFDYNEAMSLLGQASKSGLDTGALITGFRTAANMASKQGFSSISEGVSQYVNAIKNARSDTSALAMAQNMFGSRSASLMVKAIRDGSLNVKQLTQELNLNKETIKGVYEDTKDFPEQWKETIHMLKVNLLPIAESLVTVLNAIMPLLKPILGAFSKIVGWIFSPKTKKFNANTEAGEDAPIATTADFKAQWRRLWHGKEGLPAYATGGFTHGLTIAGEQGTEAVISFDKAYRDQNIGIWAQAGRLLGLDNFSLGSLASNGGNTYIYDFSNFHWNPQVDASGTDSDNFIEKLREHESEFKFWLTGWIRERELTAYA